jgi:GNAT superfamily N-acetyltransferase
MGNIREFPASQDREAALSRPSPISPSHVLHDFECGKRPLDDWLKTKARNAEGRSARTYIVCREKQIVVGYYCIATGSVGRDFVPKKLRYDMPEPVPIMLLGRLAVHSAYRGKGIGPGLLKDAMLRSLQASEIIGARAFVAHAIDDEALAFYAKYGFREFPLGTKTVFLSMKAVAAELSA